MSVTAGRPTFGSVFSGIGGIDLGLERAGWRCLWQVEVDPFCRKVLRARWPGGRLCHDVRGIGGPEPPGDGGRGEGPGGRGWDGFPGGGRVPLERPDLLCGGFPCQDLSVAGKRAGLGGARSGLFFEFARLARELRPAWLLVENVPGLLTSARGADFAVLLGELEQLGYVGAWATLDSRHFGVPQRRRRVFVVGRLGGWPLDYAQLIADRVRFDLLRFCDRCEIAGSIRRRKERVRDIEIVCIPKQEDPRLLVELETPSCPAWGFIEAVNCWKKVKGEPTGRYTQRLLPQGMKLDLFMVTPDNWGLIFAIRTGSAEFSHRVLAQGWVRAGYRSEGGVLMRNGAQTYIREERDLFDLLGIAWVEPQART